VTRNTRLVLASIAMVLGADGVRAADWERSLTSGLAAGWVSNPALVVAERTDDRIAALTLSGRAVARTELGTLTLTPRFAVTRYDSNRTLDNNTGALQLDYARHSERSQWAISAQGLVDSTLTSELGLTGASNINRRHESANAGGSFQTSTTRKLSWFANASWIGHRYIDAFSTGLNDYQYVSAGSGAAWTFNERSQLSLVLGSDRTLPKQGADQNAWSASLRWAGSWTERSSWSIQGGATRFDTAGGMATGALVELTASSASERAHWTASLRHDVSPIGYGLLVRKDQAAFNYGRNLSEHSDLGVFLNYIRSDPPNQLQSALYHGAQYLQAGAEWRWRLTDALDLNASCSHVRARGSQVAGWATGNEARIGVVWQSGRH
jgi:hypothetical protein